jgi:ABC-type Fe3+/spermidine/putrescine transport system ATPase subunit
MNTISSVQGIRLPEWRILAQNGVGASGGGKTTVLRALAGLEREAQGRVALNGEVWQAEGQFVPPQQRGVGLVFQDAALFPHLSVRRNLDYGQARIPRGLARPRCRSRMTRRRQA